MTRSFLPGIYARLYKGDALDMMRGLDDVSVDAVIMDPPYASGGFQEADRKSATSQGARTDATGPLSLNELGWFANDNMGTAGLVWLLRSVAIEAARVLRPGGWLLCFCDWRQVVSLSPALESSGMRFRNLIVWDKGNPGMGLGFRPQHELILAFTVGVPVAHDTAIGNVLRVGRQSRADRVHPTQKPVELMTMLVKAATPRGGVVLDPFMGSGSTGVAAAAAGRSFIGIEREDKYVAEAAARIEEAGAAVTSTSPARRAVQPSIFISKEQQ